MLLGLCRGLILMSEWERPAALELHIECLRSNLVERIMKAFERRARQGSCGGYFPWFLKNKYILSGLPGQKG
jgi:hypothetical protein